MLGKRHMVAANGYSVDTAALRGPQRALLDIHASLGETVGLTEPGITAPASAVPSFTSFGVQARLHSAHSAVIASYDFPGMADALGANASGYQQAETAAVNRISVINT